MKKHLILLMLLYSITKGQNIPQLVLERAEVYRPFFNSDTMGLYINARIETFELDFNGDGLLDLAITCNILCGSGGCDYVIYIKKKDGTYYSIGSFFCTGWGTFIKPIKKGKTILYNISPDGADTFGLEVYEFDGHIFKRKAIHAIHNDGNEDKKKEAIMGPSKNLLTCKNIMSYNLKD